MRIGFDFRMGGSINAGIGRYSFELLTHLLDQNQTDEYLVIYNQENVAQEDLKVLQEKGAQLISTNIRHYSFAEQLRLPRVLKKLHLDLMHFPNFNVPIFYGAKYVVTIHDVAHHKISGHKKSRLWKFYAYKYIIETAARKASKVITITEAAKKEIVEYLKVSPDKIAVTYEAPATHNVKNVDIGRVKEKFYLTRPYFLFVGTLERKKNIITLAKGFDMFLSKFRYDMDFVFAGKIDPHYPEIKDQALDIAHRDHLVFTGYVSDADQAALYQGAFAFATASLHEGFGLPGVEALKYGLPLLASNTEVFNEVYDNAAIYFDPLHPEDIAEKMRLVTIDQPFYKQMQQKAISRAALFDWAKTASETLAVYHSIITRSFEPEHEPDYTT